MNNSLRKIPLAGCALLLSALLLPPAYCASNDVLGEIHFEAASDAASTSGVWVDGEYVGYLKELNGSNQLMLLPGRHTIVVRQDGYRDFTDEVTVLPGKTQDIGVVMQRNVTQPMPHVTSTLVISANPSRAAVFMDGLYVGHVGEFNGWGRALLVPPGKHRIRVALPGYRSFEADINPLPDQKVEIKTDLQKSSVPLDDALLAPKRGTTSSPAAGNGESLPSAMASPEGR